MPGTLVDLRGLGNIEDHNAIAFCIAEPATIEEGGMMQRLAFNLGEAPFDAFDRMTGANDHPLVMQAGARLWDLLRAHPAFVSAVDQSLGAARSGETAPIILRIHGTATTAESLPWETLCRPNGAQNSGEFFALMDHISIVRQAAGMPAAAAMTFPLKENLRIAAILGCHGISAAREWTALIDAAESARAGARPIDCEIRLYACEAAIVEAASAASSEGLAVDARFMPGDSQALTIELEDFKPHLTHIFSHGSPALDGYIELATRSSFQDGGGHVYLEAPQLAEALRGVWLVTVSACQTAAPSQANSSFARALVDKGLTAAIGMRERITAADSATFTSTMYMQFLNYLKERLHTSGQVVDWGQAIVRARQAICARVGDGPQALVAPTHKAWAIPILYMRPDGFTAEIIPADSTLTVEEDMRLQREADVLREQRQSMQAMGGPDEGLRRVIESIDRRIAEIEELRRGSA